MDQATKQALLARLERDALHLCQRFGLRYRVLEAERANVKRRYGVCFSDGTIRIRLRHVATGRPLKYSSLVNTLCHELAHLQHFNHGPHFQALYARILACARREGIYRPREAGERDRMGPPPTAPGGPTRPMRPPAVVAEAPRVLIAPVAAARQLELFGSMTSIGSGEGGARSRAPRG